jgi:cytidylate kinase
MLLRFISKDTFFIFLDSNFETIFCRRAPIFKSSDGNNRMKKDYGSIPEAAVEPREFIDFQRAAYKALAKHFNALEIDTSISSIEETSNAILEYLGLP